MVTMSFPNEAKALYAYDYVSLKTDERNRRNTKKRHLGDLKRRCGSRKASPSLVGSLVNLYLPETRAINRTTADGIITDQSNQIRQTFNKNQREAILDEWARPSSVPDENHKHKVDRDSPTELRPQTAPGYHGLNHIPFQHGPAPRPYSTGSFRTPPRKPPQPSGFMWVKMKQMGSKQRRTEQKGLNRITDEIHDYWQNEDKQEREKKSKAKKQQDSFTGGWLSFAGSESDSISLVDAFTGDSNPDTDQFYNIDGKVGSVVARHLQSGSKLHIGKNGNLQSETLKIRRSSIESSELGEFPSKLDKPPYLIPLDWSEQMLKTDVKVMGTSKTVTPPPVKISCERHPIVYSKLIPTNEKPTIHIKLDKYCIRHRSKAKLNIDGTESLSQRITNITVDDLTNEDADAMTAEEYNTLLTEKLKKDVSQHDSVQSLSPQLPEMNTEKSGISLASMDRMSDISNLTVDKPPSLGSSEMSHSRKEKLSSAFPCRTLVRNQKSAPAMAVRSNTSTSSWTSNPALRPRSEMVRRREQSAGSRRATSGTSRRYIFDRPVTPRSVHSPRPKPGHLFRSGVSSINSGPLEGEQEYIQIAHQIPSRHHHAGSEASMDGSFASLLRVDNHQDCGCTEDAKRVVSAALSGQSPFIDVPHGSGQRGVTPQVSFKTSSDTDDDDDSDQYSEKDDLSDLDDFLDSPLDDVDPQFEDINTQDEHILVVPDMTVGHEEQVSLDNWEQISPDMSREDHAIERALSEDLDESHEGNLQDEPGHKCDVTEYSKNEITDQVDGCQGEDGLVGEGEQNVGSIEVKEKMGLPEEHCLEPALPTTTPRSSPTNELTDSEKEGQI